MQLKNENSVRSNISVNKETDDLILLRKGGGSVIDKRPLFSSDGEILYVVWKQVIRSYSALTGDFVREFEPAESKIVGIALLPNLHREKRFDVVIGCTDIGEILHWNIHNGLITTKIKLVLPENPYSKDVKLKTFHIVNYLTNTDKSTINALTTYFIKGGNEKILRISLFDLDMGIDTMSKDFKGVSEDYCIDLITNYGPELQNNYIAFAYDSYFYVLYPTERLRFLRHKTGRNVTCICGHPIEESVAVGDCSGRVQVWRNLSQFNPVKATYHWHTLPVTDIAFSTSGGHMYTGGGESVLVKWLLSNPQNKAYLPRLPAPIKHLTVAPENTFVAVSTLDNGIVIVNPQRKITAVIQNFTWGISSTPKSLFPAGLCLDHRTNSVVLNSRIGHIQFFNTHTKSLLYNVNITEQCIISQERNTVIVNTEVTRIALNADGTWLITVEERNDKNAFIEVRIKFWEFNKEKQSFQLNTSIEYPHEIGVNALKFKPKSSSCQSNEEFAVTAGKDKIFRVWYLSDPESIDSDRSYWRCYSYGSYHNESPPDATFSADGSLLGVAFGPSLTLWNSESLELKNSLSHSLCKHPIIRVEFGVGECSCLVVVASKEHIAVWNLLSLTMKWSVPINLAILTADPFSTFMAAFTTDNKLIIFTPDDSEPVYIRHDIVADDVSLLGACFVPNSKDQEENAVEWQKKAHLVFLDSEQELLTLESKSESSIALENIFESKKLPLTSFNRIVAAERISDAVKPGVIIHDYSRIADKGLIDELLSVPAHTLPPMRMLCMPFILSLIGKTKSKTVENKTERSTDDFNSEDSDSEDEVKKIPTTNDKVNNALENAEDEVNEVNDLIELDWDFLTK